RGTAWSAADHDLMPMPRLPLPRWRGQARFGTADRFHLAENILDRLTCTRDTGCDHDLRTVAGTFAPPVGRDPAQPRHCRAAGAESDPDQGDGRCAGVGEPGELAGQRRVALLEESDGPTPGRC